MPTGLPAVNSPASGRAKPPGGTNPTFNLKVTVNVLTAQG